MLFTIHIKNWLKRINIGYEYNKEYVENHILYSKDRKKYIKNKSFFSLIVMYLKGKYKGYGSFKTFVGDLCSIVYKWDSFVRVFYSFYSFVKIE